MDLLTLARAVEQSAATALLSGEGPQGKRRHRRHSFTAAVTVTWRDNKGQAHSVECQGIDLSESGCCLAAAEPVDAQRVRLYCEDYDLIGPASVRHCRKAGERYLIGVQFLGDLRWRAAALRRKVTQLSEELSQAQRRITELEQELEVLRCGTAA